MANDENTATAGMLVVPNGTGGNHAIDPTAVTAVSDAGAGGLSGILSEIHLVGGEVLKVALEAAKVLELLASLKL